MIDFAFEFSYADEKHMALKNVKGKIPTGTCIVLCGGSGCGKSTLLKCINGLIPNFYEGKLKGFCYINGKTCSEMSVGETGELVASVFQDPRSQFFTINSSTEIAFGLENLGLPQAEIQRKVEEAFRLFGLERLKDRNVYELSSGERQIVSILAAWAMNTDVLLLDEPTANLDYAAIEALHHILLQLKKQGKTLIFSEHRLYYLNGIADAYWLMENGEITGRFTPEEMAQLTPQQRCAMSVRNLDLANLSIPKNKPAFHSRKPGFDFEVSGLKFGYQKKTGRLIQDLTFSATCGEAVGIIGTNGCGKTTAGKIMSGLIKATSGTILYDHKKMSRKKLQENVLFVMQEAEFQFYTNSVLNELKYGQRITPEFQEKAELLLKKFGMWEIRDRHPFSLSGGQMQKLVLMIACLSPKQIVVLDEPTSGLDARSLQGCAELILEMQKEKLIFIITHDLELIAQVCTRCICIADGKIEREFCMYGDSCMKDLMTYMKTNFSMSEDTEPSGTKTPASAIHPVTKILLWILAMIAVSTTNDLMVWGVNAVLIVMLLVDRRYALALMGGGISAVLFGLHRCFPSTALSFAFVFFPRLLALWLSMCTFIGGNEASRTIAALRYLHVPEKLIMICSVVFRFFPVLSRDMILMRHAIRTRGAFVTLWQKLCAFPQYIEILTVPMALRVIRIAETLSASAETRGIDLKRKRHSYISLRFTLWDIPFLFLLFTVVIISVLH